MFQNYAMKTFLYMKTLKCIYLENRVFKWKWVGFTLDHFNFCVESEHYELLYIIWLNLRRILIDQFDRTISHKKKSHVHRYMEWCITDGSSKAVAVIFWLRKGNDFTKKIFPLVLFCFNWVCTFHRTGHIYWDS